MIVVIWCVLLGLCVLLSSTSYVFLRVGSSQRVGDVTPITSAEISVVPGSDAYGSNLHHAVLSKTSPVCIFHSNSILINVQQAPHSLFETSLTEVWSHRAKGTLADRKFLTDVGTCSLFGKGVCILEHQNKNKNHCCSHLPYSQRYYCLTWWIFIRIVSKGRCQSVSGLGLCCS